MKNDMENQMGTNLTSKRTMTRDFIYSAICERKGLIKSQERCIDELEILLKSLPLELSEKQEEAFCNVAMKILNS